MAKVILRPEIQGISGRIGNMIFRTYADGKVTMHKAPDYTRRTPVTKNEKQSRNRFGERAKRVT